MEVNMVVLLGKVTNLDDNTIELDNEFEINFNKEMKEQVEKHLFIGTVVGIKGKLECGNVVRAEKLTIISKGRFDV